MYVSLLLNGKILMLGGGTIMAFYHNLHSGVFDSIGAQLIFFPQLNLILVLNSPAISTVNIII